MRKLTGYGPALVVLAAAAVVLFAGPSIVWQLTYAQTRASIIQAGEGLVDNPVLQHINQAYRDIAALVEPSVVHISVEGVKTEGWNRGRPFTSSGSGWVYDEHGHVVTNYHVVEDASQIEVQLYTGELRQASLVGYDQFTDVALIKIAAGRLFAATRADIGLDPSVEQGDMVFAFGSPFDFRFSMSSGVVSGVGRSVGVIRDDRGRWLGYENFIQVDAAINPGNSGGPLTDARGRVIGMNTAIATSGDARREGGQFAGIGLAIPLEMIEPVVQQLVESGLVEKGYLGIGVVERRWPLGLELREQLGYPASRAGVVVARIAPGDGASSAGLRVDDVVYAIDGEPVIDSADFHAAYVVDDGRPVALHVWRYDDNVEAGRDLIVEVPAGEATARGVNVLQMSDRVSDLLDHRGYHDRGVRVTRTERNGPAAMAGLRRSDVILKVNDRPIGSMRQLQSIISSMLPGETARLEVWRYNTQLDDGRLINVDVELARLPLEAITGVLPGSQSRDRIEVLGIAAMSTNTPALADRYGVAFHRGVLIESIVPGSQLDGTVPPGSVIIEVGAEPISDVDELFDRLSDFDLRERRGVRVSFILPDESFYQQVLYVE